MTLVDYDLLGTYTGFCYEEIVTDLGLEDAFRSVTGKSLEEYEYDPAEMGEDTLINRVLDAADRELLVVSDTVGYDERMHYQILSLTE